MHQAYQMNEVETFYRFETGWSTAVWYGHMEQRERCRVAMRREIVSVPTSWDSLLWLEHATLDFLEIDKVWRVDAGLSPDLDQLR